MFGHNFSGWRSDELKICQMLSSIYSFMINQSGGANTNTNSAMNTLLIALEQAIGQDQFNALFGSGNDLEDFIPTGQIEINGVSLHH